jgi:uracil-DNA glycosylase
MNDGDLYYLVDRLASIEVADDVCNQYAYGDENNMIRQDNLLLYLRQIAETSPDTLLVAEAPGYRGCRLTGIPVTSRAIMLDGIAPLSLFGTAHGYRITNDPGFENIHREQSATILWDTLSRFGMVAAIWNAFPFHPHKPGNPRSNRKPRKSETDIGKLLLQDLLNIFAFERIVAVGNVAEATLHQMDIDCVKVRHPAQGGKQSFISGIKGLIHHVEDQQ